MKTTRVPIYRQCLHTSIFKWIHFQARGIYMWTVVVGYYYMITIVELSTWHIKAYFFCHLICHISNVVLYCLVILKKKKSCTVICPVFSSKCVLYFIYAFIRKPIWCMTLNSKKIACGAKTPCENFGNFEIKSKRKIWNSSIREIRCFL